MRVKTDFPTSVVSGISSSNSNVLLTVFNVTLEVCGGWIDLRGGWIMRWMDQEVTKKERGGREDASRCKRV